MSAGDIMTMKQAKEKMEYYREIFDVVAHHTSITIESYFCSMQMQNL